MSYIRVGKQEGPDCMEISSEEKDGARILRVSGRLDASNCGDLKKLFDALCARGGTVKYVFDLESMDFIDSAGLGAIVACLKKATDAKGDIKIANLKPKPRMVFEITRAYKIFDIFDNAETALASFSAPKN
jgi:anti-sigma B factor antagonist